MFFSFFWSALRTTWHVHPPDVALKYFKIFSQNFLKIFQNIFSSYNMARTSSRSCFRIFQNVFSKFSQNIFSPYNMARTSSRCLYIYFLLFFLLSLQHGTYILQMLLRIYTRSLHQNIFFFSSMKNRGKIYFNLIVFICLQKVRRLEITLLINMIR